MQIIEDPIGAVQVKVLTSQTDTYKLLECDTWPKILASEKNIGDKRWLFAYFFL